ncbi:helix-hairpin-helix domain-containing protein [Modestobacter roseus]|uniref:Competence protein ComEA n=1 Tax=Modestobacter roseus TaxID=1181884 RepID=A0A562IMI3_9ACTN|nr:ComEA family DNA-binding protein [Modestobacter roseus]MQA34119.1 competence protein ComEA [Modestobacter roseus]TWH72118.1 competence protein ComEA [Modestobacter roseus]
MRSSPRPGDDDVIRARLRALLAEGQQRPGGWVPEPVDEDEEPPDGEQLPGPRRLWAADDQRTTPLDEAADEPSLPAGLGRHRAPGPAARVSPGRSGAWTLWAAAVLAAAAVVGWTWADRPTVDQVPAGASVAVPSAPSSGPAPGVPESSAPAAGAEVVVSVIGQVASPGLVTLPAGSRVADALAAVGGLLPEADPASVNAAAVLVDGEQLAVGLPGAVAGPAAAAGGPAGGLVDLNRATVAELDALPGIGPVLAQRIVDHRDTSGPFTSVEQLDDVSGIGPAVYADLVDRVTV